MKKLLILFAIATSMSGYSQETKTNSYGITVGLGNAYVMQKSIEGGVGYDLENGLELGLNYYRKLAHNLKFESGIFWHQNQLRVTPNFYPGIDMAPHYSKIRIIYIPLFLRINILKYLFINGGIIGDIDLSNENYINDQTGIGAGVGFGGEIPVFKKFIVQINPYINLHGLILAGQVNYPERIFDSGIKIGLRTK